MHTKKRTLLKAMTDFTREYGVYSSNDMTDKILRPCDGRAYTVKAPMTTSPDPACLPGIVMPWDEKKKDFPQVTGDLDLMKRIWGETDGLADMFVYQCLLSF